MQAASAEVMGSDGQPITLDEKTTYQRIDGFGGCFNDLGWRALEALPDKDREAALKELFDPSGANFTVGRAPIGANDFSFTWYSYDETPGDYAMKNFSIDHDRGTIIPFMKAAMKYQPHLGIWAVPWCPPSWMKTNGRYKGGSMKDDARTLAAYALYFSKYVQAYRAAGINLFAVMPQNEPMYSDNIYPQCVWSGQLMDRFLRDNLAPQFERGRVKIELWQGTIVPTNLAAWVEPVLDDPKANPLITGVGYQYTAQEVMQATHDKWPDKKIAQTETECYHGENSWDEGLTTFRKIIEDTNHFASSYYYWNLVLDEVGMSTWGWRQNSLLTVDRHKDTIRYNPEFYSMKHFSANVLPGATRIGVSGGPLKDIVAFKNPDGSKVVVFVNETANPVPAVLDAGSEQVKLNVPAQSMNTITLSAQ